MKNGTRAFDLRVIGEWIDEQGWLETAADVTQAGVKSFFNALGDARRPIKNFLNGTWLGHPLHPVVTDIPLGAWTVTLLLDALQNGDRRSGVARAADASLALGLAGAAASAMSGLTDWSDTDARPRRVGMAHAILNIGGTLLFTGSLFWRRRGCRQAGKTLAIAGYLSIIAAAYLGGELVYHEQIGVDHSSGKEMPDERFAAVLPEEKLSEGKLTRALYKDTPILLVRLGRKIHAIAETCAHLGGPLSEGKLEGDTVICPWHASAFELDSGKVVSGPSAFPQPCLEARVRDGKVEVRTSRR
jgi:nitrite reductase/ring-hydroxylating ferredoxin subunit/uncharacterized membrane protein